MGPFLEEFVASHVSRLSQDGWRVDASIGDGGAEARFDRDALEQVLLNLVDNAVKYAAAGRELAVTGGRDGDRYRVRVEDRGPGVGREHRARIFEKFYRVDTSLTARAQGSGLGLSIARGLARDLGGDVRYEPREGGGSRFTLEMPLADAARPGGAAGGGDGEA